MDKDWNDDLMAANLSSEQRAALASIPSNERLPVAWYVFNMGESAQLRRGRQINCLIPIGDKKVAYSLWRPKENPSVILARRVSEPAPIQAPEGYQPGASDTQTFETMNRRWADLGFSFSGSWEKANLLKLHQVLLALSPEEREALKNTEFNRQAKPDQDSKFTNNPDCAGETRLGGDRIQIFFYDRSFRVQGSDLDERAFLGKGLPFSEGSMFHEIGHAIGNKNWRYFTDRFKDHPAPTEYCGEGFKEYLAETYYLFKTDPDRLKAFDSELYEYFASGDYLKKWKQGEDGAWRVEK
jgi:hypothetical protein